MDRYNWKYAVYFVCCLWLLAGAYAGYPERMQEAYDGINLTPNLLNIYYWLVLICFGGAACYSLWKFFNSSGR
jgi:hypothetical protein